MSEAMTERPMNDAELVETLALAHALLESGWCMGTFAERSDGMMTSSCGLSARRYCLVGALTAAVDHVRPDLEMEFAADLPAPVNALVQHQLPPDTHDSLWNDALGRTQADVLALLERAAAAIGK